MKIIYVSFKIGRLYSNFRNILEEECVIMKIIIFIKLEVSFNVANI